MTCKLLNLLGFQVVSLIMPLRPCAEAAGAVDKGVREALTWLCRSATACHHRPVVLIRVVYTLVACIGTTIPVINFDIRLKLN